MTTKTQDARGAVDEAQASNNESIDAEVLAARNGELGTFEDPQPPDATSVAEDVAAVSAEESVTPDSESASPDSIEPDDDAAQSLAAEATNADVTDEPRPSLANWLSGELRPSPSKSVPPPGGTDSDVEQNESEIGAASVGVAAGSLIPPPSPETLAPLALPSDELDDEDLAVLPVGARGRSPSMVGKVLLAALGALVAILLFTKFWSPAAPTPPETAATAAPVVEQPNADAVARHPVQADPASPTAEQASEAPAGHTYRGPWLPPHPATDDDAEATRRARGPSVGRFPDLPPEHWSELRRKEREQRAQRAAEAAATDE